MLRALASATTGSRAKLFKRLQRELTSTMMSLGRTMHLVHPQSRSTGRLKCPSQVPAQLEEIVSTQSSLISSLSPSTTQTALTTTSRSLTQLPMHSLLAKRLQSTSARSNGSTEIRWSLASKSKAPSQGYSRPLTLKMPESTKTLLGTM